MGVQYERYWRLYMCTGKEKALCQKEALCHKEGDRAPRGRPTTANLGATTPRLRAGWTGMLGGTSRPTNPEYELDG